MQLELSSPAQYVPRVGPAMAEKLEKLGIFTVRDLLYHIPFRYNDYRHTTKISGIRPEETVTVVGTIESIVNIFTKSGKRMQKAVLSDQTGHIECVWYNQMFLTKILKPQTTVSVSGKANWFASKLVLESPVYEPMDGIDAHLHTGRLVPIYPETAGVTSNGCGVAYISSSKHVCLIYKNHFHKIFLLVKNSYHLREHYKMSIFQQHLTRRKQPKQDSHLMKCFFLSPNQHTERSNVSFLPTHQY